MICKNCGESINDTSNFCNRCGASCITDTTNTEINITQENIESKSNYIKIKSSKPGIKAEIKQNAVLFALPITFLVWNIFSELFSKYLLGFVDLNLESYAYFSIAISIIGQLFYGLFIGGLTIAVIKCSKTFQFIYLIPYALVWVYSFVSKVIQYSVIHMSLRMYYKMEVIYSSFGILDIILFIILIKALSKTRLKKDNSIKSTICIATLSTIAIYIINILGRSIINLFIERYFGEAYITDYYISFFETITISSDVFWGIINCIISIIGLIIAITVFFKRIEAYSNISNTLTLNHQHTISNELSTMFCHKCKNKLPTTSTVCPICSTTITDFCHIRNRNPSKSYAFLIVFSAVTFLFTVFKPIFKLYFNEEKSSFVSVSFFKENRVNNLFDDSILPALYGFFFIYTTVLLIVTLLSQINPKESHYKILAFATSIDIVMLIILLCVYYSEWKDPVGLDIGGIALLVGDIVLWCTEIYAMQRKY